MAAAVDNSEQQEDPGSGIPRAPDTRGNDRQEGVALPEENQGTPLVSVLYSEHRALYRLPAMDLDIWLSVQVYSLADWGANIAAARTTDGKGWRKAYRNWSMIRGASLATLPADDPLVIDYQQHAGDTGRTEAEPS
jgi:hypothetical protein